MADKGKGKAPEAAASPRRNTATKKDKKAVPAQKIYLKATEDYVAKDKTELNIKKGDILKFRGKDDSGWFEGAHKGKDHTGFFPGHIVVECTRDGAPVANSQFASKTPRTGVVTDSTVAHKKETKEILAKHLETRPDKEQLINRNIFVASKLTPELFEAQKKLEQAKTKDFLANFLRSQEQNREPLLTEEAVTEFILQMADPKDGIPHGKHTKKITKSYDACFTGKQARDWLLSKGHCSDRDSAVSTMTFLLNSGVFTATNGKVKQFKSTRIYRLTLNCLDLEVLNTDKKWHSSTRNALDLSAFLLAQMLELVDKFKRTNGSVDFETLRRSLDFKKVSLATAELQKVDLSKLSDADKMPFWINVCNLLTLHGHAKRGVPSSMTARREHQEKLRYLVANHEWTRNDIDSIIFRGEPVARPQQEMTSPRGEKVSAPPAPDDRMGESLKLAEKPLWLFGLSDGTTTTPFFTVFTFENFQMKLQQHAQEFIQMHTKCDHEKHIIIYPVLLQRLQKDMGFSEEKLHAFVRPFLTERDQRLFDKVAEFGGKITIQWTQREYNPNYFSQVDESTTAAAAAAAK